LLCGAIELAATSIQALEARLLGRAWLEALVIAILLGALLRTVWTPGARWIAGVEFSAKVLLEIAVALLGATVSAASLAALEPAMLGGIFALVAMSVAGGYGLARLLGLPTRMAMLIACGNSICGNSAIAAVAPVIGAKAEEVAAAIAYTAVFGVGVVLGVPLLAAALDLSPLASGVLAGLTVYAVPQVLAAAAPAGVLAVQTGTLVKLVRVLTLGPLCIALALRSGRGGSRTMGSVARLVPWFLVGFTALAMMRALGVLSPEVAQAAGQASSLLTVTSMAALGLGVDFAALARAGVRVSTAVAVSLMLLFALAVGLMTFLGLI
jgi:uncharacterized integral membrane protein (TIGR00698 family)